MKKFVSFLLAVLLLAGMGLTAFAESGNSQTVTTAGTELPVTGTYQAASDDDLYNVKITWTSLNFIFTPASKGKWDPERLTHSDPTPAKWECGGSSCGKFTVQNNSNPEGPDEIDVTFSFAKNSELFDTTQNLRMRFAGTLNVSGEGILSGGSVNTYVVNLPSTSGDNFQSSDVYIQPFFRDNGYAVKDFGSGTLGTINITISHYTVSDPGIPEGPGTESVQPTPAQTEAAAPAPEAGEIAANG